MWHSIKVKFKLPRLRTRLPVCMMQYVYMEELTQYVFSQCRFQCIYIYGQLQLSKHIQICYIATYDIKQSHSCMLTIDLACLCVDTHGESMDWTCHVTFYSYRTQLYSQLDKHNYVIAACKLSTYRRTECVEEATVNKGQQFDRSNRRRWSFTGIRGLRYIVMQLNNYVIATCSKLSTYRRTDRVNDATLNENKREQPFDRRNKYRWSIAGTRELRNRYTLDIYSFRGVLSQQWVKYFYRRDHAIGPTSS